MKERRRKSTTSQTISYVAETSAEQRRISIELTSALQLTQYHAIEIVVNKQN